MLSPQSTQFLADKWDNFRQNPIGHWLLTDGAAIGGMILFTLAATRLVRWSARKFSNRLAHADSNSGIVRSETVKHRQALASVISSVAIAVLYVVVAMQIASQLGLSVGSLVAPAAVLGAALGFGAQRIVQDLLAGFFVITEKHYGFGDLVQLTVTGSAKDARGTVEDVTLRATKLRSGDGEVVMVPNGQIVKTVNLSKDWARAVVDIPVPVSADLNRVNALLHEVSHDAMCDDGLPDLLLDEPAVMGIESIGVETVNLRLVARTLPGQQFEVGRRLRTLVLAALRGAGIVIPPGTAPSVDTLGSDIAGANSSSRPSPSREALTR